MKKTKKSNNQPLYSIYGARESNSGDRVNISLVRGEEDDKRWATVSLKKKGGRVKVKLTSDSVTITIPRIDVEKDDDEDEEDEEDEDEDDEIPF